jgi:HEAT repeat protein
VLVVVMLAGASIGASVLALTVVWKAVRGLTERRRVRAEGRVRPLLLEAMSEYEVPPAAATMRRADGAAMERLVLQFLPKVHGEAHEVLEHVLTQRGVLARTLRRSKRRSSAARGRAALLLGMVGSREARHRVEQMVMTDPNFGVRVAATRALGQVGTARAAAVLLEALDHPQPVPEGIVATALVEIGPDAVTALRNALGEKGLGETAQRCTAAEVLGLLEAMDSWRDLAVEVARDDDGIRLRAIRALGQLGVPGAATAIGACLAATESTAIRTCAAIALGRIGDTEWVAALATCADDADHQLAQVSTNALAQLGGSGHDALVRLADGHTPAAPYAREALDYAALAPGGVLG